MTNPTMVDYPLDVRAAPLSKSVATAPRALYLRLAEPSMESRQARADARAADLAPS